MLKGTQQITESIFIEWSNTWSGCLNTTPACSVRVFPSSYWTYTFKITTIYTAIMFESIALLNIKRQPDEKWRSFHLPQYRLRWPNERKKNVFKKIEFIAFIRTFFKSYWINYRNFSVSPCKIGLHSVAVHSVYFIFSFCTSITMPNQWYNGDKMSVDVNYVFSGF